MDEKRGSTDESFSEYKVAFRDDFAENLAWNAGQYHEEDNYLDIDLS